MPGHDDHAAMNVMGINVAILHAKLKCMVLSVMIAIAYLNMRSSHDLREVMAQASSRQQFKRCRLRNAGYASFNSFLTLALLVVHVKKRCKCTSRCSSPALEMSLCLFLAEHSSMAFSVRFSCIHALPWQQARAKIGS